ncbi:MoxR-like ATPase [Fluviicoccus keumensis]|uniref:MoxR-like ATPase n=1 Tax=Fluviicoccus keumensis TaxID=1435465 RepID=A0A4Q7Z5X9_9GAMM|nr:MoxR family ATPase [Fluviicoccus keumensis]RZU45123.1 MoxR-like ATPase [Fluviicoccus keumensis]
MSDPTFPSQPAVGQDTASPLKSAGAKVQAMRHEISKALVGQKEAVEQVLIALLASGHVLVEGVPGLGKTLLVRALSRTIGGTFNRIQFTPDLMPSDVTGHALYDLKSEQFHIRRGPVFAHLVLADEINRAPAKTQAALLEAMQEYQVTIDGQAHQLPRPFLVMATQNPIEQEGTYPLPEAQLDRFLLKVVIGYPTLNEEQRLLTLVTRGKMGDTLDFDSLQTLLSPEDIQAVQQLVAQIRIDDSIRDYAAHIVRATRDWPGISVGAGPRGGIALLRAARAAALLEGRDFVIPDDVKRLAEPALRHRLVLSPELEMEGQSADDVIKAILQSVPAPRQ